MYYLAVSSNYEDFYYETTFEYESEDENDIKRCLNDILSYSEEQLKPLCFNTQGGFRSYLLCESEKDIELLPPEEYVDCYLLLMIGNTPEVEEGYCGKGDITYMLQYAINSEGDVQLDGWIKQEDVCDVE